MLEHFDVGRGPAIVFIHGFGVDARMWRPQLDAFAPTHRAIAPTLPGFGPRPRALGVGAARAVDALLGELGVDAAHVVGLSLGGAVATDLALAFPARVRSLTLSDPLLLGRRPNIGAWREATALARAGKLDEARAAWARDKLFAGVADPRTRALVEEMIRDYSCAHWAGNAETLFEVEAPEPRLGEIDRPALVVSGEHDTPSFREMAETYAARLPRARLHILPDAGHMASLEQPEAFNALLREFFDTCR